MAPRAALVEELGAALVGLLDLDLAPAAGRGAEGNRRRGAEGGADGPETVEGAHGPRILSAAVKALAAILSGLAVAAGSGCFDEEDEPGRSVTVRPEGTVAIGADEYRFDPSRIVVRGGGRNVRLRLVLANRGELAHNLHVLDGDREIAGLRSFAAGEKRPLSTNLRPGKYDYVCTVADHEELGMVGKLEVR